MIVRIQSAGVTGIAASPVDVEVDGAQAGQNPAFTVVGLPDKSITESRDRVRAAIGNAGYDFPFMHITVNLAPADLKKEGPAYDLPIAVGVLGVSQQIDPDAISRHAMIGELALDGRVRPVAGVLPIAIELKKRHVRSLLVPADNAGEAAVVQGIDVIPVDHLREVVSFINGNLPIEPFRADVEKYFDRSGDHPFDFGDVKGQEAAKRALMIAAAGGHNVLMLGNPGVGKSMLSKRLPTVLPRMTLEEALETTKIYSVAGQVTREQPLVTQRPFRAPHHTISDAGMIGGGTTPRPGEISMAHNGVLFLDEFPEFNRNTLEVMRQPLEDGTVTISRASGSLTFPARLMLVAAMNPCPCGYLGHPKKKCSCTVRMIAQYRSKISGPLLDRIDIHLEVPSVDFKELSGEARGMSSAEMAAAVQRARDVQTARFQRAREGLHNNAGMNDQEVSKHAALRPDVKSLLDTAMESLHLSARAYTRIRKIARTIADLEGASDIGPEHITEAIGYRTLDRAEA
ncbi:MAG: YifB family Mg chelatase-like AAA ATPase [Planctomycetes bacterium]|nr:YifB family Mg chelatase-like AAA ATPase [Planctomycetota bacterium]MCW8135846.1 YifB family Mg chelatase-like AAA ATPase [Planctomycetota bacterium]